MIVPNNKPTKAPNIQKDLNTYIYKKVYAMDGPELRLCLIEFMKYWYEGWSNKELYELLKKENEDETNQR